MMLFFSTEEEKKKLASSTTTQTAAEQDCVSCKIIGTGSLFGIGCYIIFATRPVGYYATRPVTRQIIRSLSAVPFYASVARWMSNNDLTIFVMGVSGCGKSTIGSSLASRLNRTFKDGDTFHPPENIEKMRSGIPLTDEDRLPWLQLINAFARSNPGCVIACSALKKLYRSVLSENLPPTTEGNTGGGGMFVLLNLKRQVEFVLSSNKKWKKARKERGKWTQQTTLNSLAHFRKFFKNGSSLVPGTSCHPYYLTAN
ncbi:hypothetical protein L3Y34_007608 [Caenorhabditis briggsae]|uniref:gluconokinase n=1 Tax=Caenorhabditis briggsae TaxID=6238 RepID=A0AAE9A0C1_CAEBR|nr:hypothetical protein L3Y34_007608 [Caenorhabditis briggsae]